MFQHSYKLEINLIKNKNKAVIYREQSIVIFKSSIIN